MDIMYPAGQFDSVDHRRLMAIAERTKSVIDATLYDGIVEEIENASGGNDSEYAKAIPLKPAHWATRLGHARLHGHGLHRRLHGDRARGHRDGLRDHVQPHGSRRRPGTSTSRRTTSTPAAGIIKTAVAYALTQETEFSAQNVEVDPVGPGRLRGEPRHRDRHRRERTGHAAGARRRTGSARTASRWSSAHTASRTRTGSATRTR